MPEKETVSADSDARPPPERLSDGPCRDREIGFVSAEEPFGVIVRLRPRTPLFTECVAAKVWLSNVEGVARGSRPPRARSRRARRSARGDAGGEARGAEQ